MSKTAFREKLSLDLDPETHRASRAGAAPTALERSEVLPEIGEFFVKQARLEASANISLAQPSYPQAPDERWARLGSGIFRDIRDSLKFQS